MAEKNISYKPIEELKFELAISDAVFAGVRALCGWGAGKQVSEAEFKQACDDFCKAPAGGKPLETNRKRGKQ